MRLQATDKAQCLGSSRGENSSKSSIYIELQDDDLSAFWAVDILELLVVGFDTIFLWDVL